MISSPGSSECREGVLMTMAFCAGGPCAAISEKYEGRLWLALNCLSGIIGVQCKVVHVFGRNVGVLVSLQIYPHSIILSHYRAIIIVYRKYGLFAGK